MPSFERYTCANCSEEFAAHPSSNAAERGYCSPRCESEGEGYE